MTFKKDYHYLWFVIHAWLTSYCVYKMLLPSPLIALEGFLDFGRPFWASMAAVNTFLALRFAFASAFKEIIEEEKKQRKEWFFMNSALDERN